MRYLGVIPVAGQNKKSRDPAVRLLSFSVIRSCFFTYSRRTNRARQIARSARTTHHPRQAIHRQSWRGERLCLRLPFKPFWLCPSRRFHDQVAYSAKEQVRPHAPFDRMIPVHANPPCSANLNADTELPSFTVFILPRNIAHSAHIFNESRRQVWL